MIGASLLDEDLDHYSLEYLSQLWLGHGKVEEGIRAYADEHDLDPKADLWRMPPEIVAPYAAGDVDRTAALIDEELRRLDLEAQDHPNIIKAWNLECDLIPLSIAMTWNGIRVDEDALDRAGARFRKLREAAVAEMKARWGVDVEPWKQSTCLAMFAQAGLQVPRLKKVVDGVTVEMGPTIRADWLEAQTHDAAKLLLRARKASKATGTFIEGWKRHIHDGRLHPHWHQTRSDEGGTISFRYSCSDPNLQQVPYRDPDMARILRPIFLPDAGESLHSLDYSQQEPRLLVHYAYTNNVIGAADAHRLYQDRTADFHQLAAVLTALERDIAKQINLGIIYGMGQAKLAVKDRKSVV